MDINDIIRIGERPNEEIIADLKKKTISVPSWGKNSKGATLCRQSTTRRCTR